MTAQAQRPQQPQPSRLANIPDELLHDELLNNSIAHLLPSAYNFEIHKTIHHLRHFGARRVALQMPEGLTMFATAIADIVSTYTDAEPVIMGDVTYGACCIDDYTARALGCDFLVHYAHSCLVPLDQTGTSGMRTLYVFVEIALDVDQLARTIRYNFPSDSDAFQALVAKTDPELNKTQANARPKIAIAVEDEGSSGASSPGQSRNKKRRRTHLALVGTVQFINALAPLKDALERELAPDAPLLTDGAAALSRKRITAGEQSERRDDSHGLELATDGGTLPQYDRGAYRLTIPQIRPLSPGEILGCTSPTLPAVVSHRARRQTTQSIDAVLSQGSTSTDLGTKEDAASTEEEDDNDEAVDALLYLGDGRFHLESAMIANPDIAAYFRFDPYSRKFEREGYDHARMRLGRARAVGEARESLERARRRREDAGHSGNRVKDTGLDAASSAEDPARSEAWGLILGTLGRQGSTKVLSHLRTLLATQHNNGKDGRASKEIHHPNVPILLSELSPAKLALFNPPASEPSVGGDGASTEGGSRISLKRRDHLAAFVQTSCPRLSIDWGSAFDRPLLSPYEAALALGAPNTTRTRGTRPPAVRSHPQSKGDNEDTDTDADADPKDKLDEALAGWERAALSSATHAHTTPNSSTETERYPMDFYADDSLGPWTPRHGMGTAADRRRKAAQEEGGAAGRASGQRSGGANGRSGGATAVLMELRRKRAERQAAAAAAAAAAATAGADKTAVAN